MLQKYNRYIDLMPERRISDMTPLERFACWHLRRDLFIRSDGSVAFCKQDLSNQQERGHLDDSSLLEIWKNSSQYWADHIKGDYNHKPNCRECDEYFTFNF